MEGSDPTWVSEEKAPFRAVHDEGLHTGYSRFNVSMTKLSMDFVYSGSRALPYTNASDHKDAGVIYDSFVLTKA